MVSMYYRPPWVEQPIEMSFNTSNIWRKKIQTGNILCTAGCDISCQVFEGLWKTKLVGSGQKKKVMNGQYDKSWIKKKKAIVFQCSQSHQPPKLFFLQWRKQQKCDVCFSCFSSPPALSISVYHSCSDTVNNTIKQTTKNKELSCSPPPTSTPWYSYG